MDATLGPQSFKLRTNAFSDTSVITAVVNGTLIINAVLLTLCKHNSYICLLVGTCVHQCCTLQKMCGCFDNLVAT